MEACTSDYMAASSVCTNQQQTTQMLANYNAMAMRPVEIGRGESDPGASKLG